MEIPTYLPTHHCLLYPATHPPCLSASTLPDTPIIPSFHPSVLLSLCPFILLPTDPISYLAIFALSFVFPHICTLICHLSAHPLTYPSTHPSIQSPTHPAIHLSNHLPIYSPIHSPFIHLSLHPLHPSLFPPPPPFPIHLSICSLILLFIHPQLLSRLSIYTSMWYLCLLHIHPLIHPLIYSTTHLFARFSSHAATYASIYHPLDAHIPLYPGHLPRVRLMPGTGGPAQSDTGGPCRPTPTPAEV